MVEPKIYFVEQLEAQLGINEKSSILELGCGRLKYLLPLLSRYPDLRYVGVEPKKKDADWAKDATKNFPNVKILHQLAYEPIIETDFDICLSLSVLEHVKQLEKFLTNSLQSVKPGGHIIHRYDLGHALYPSCLKERLNIFLGNHFPRILPERKFVRYLDIKTVKKIMEDNNAKVEKISYHQMPSHKAFLKAFDTNTDTRKKLAQDILDWEFQVSEHLNHIDQKKREKLFPTITVWATKR